MLTLHIPKQLAKTMVRWLDNVFDVDEPEKHPKQEFDDKTHAHFLLKLES